MHCEKHNIEYESKEVRIPSGQVIVTLGCPECMKERDECLAAEENRKSDEIKTAQYREMNIEPLFDDADFDSFETPTPELAHAKETVLRLVSGEIRQIVMTGKNGTGKTHLAIAALKKLGGKIFSMYEVATRIRGTYGNTAKEDELDVVNELTHLPLLVIDEMGRTKGSDAETNWLSHIIDKRHSRRLPTILISNKHVKKYCPNKDHGGCRECLENYISDDIMSRINQWGILLQFAGEDWRKRQNQIPSGSTGK